MLKRAAIWFGVVFVVIGVLGFIPALAPNGYLFGFIQVDGAHNVVHLLTGAIALGAGMSTERNSQLYFQVFGVIYGLLVILGVFHGNAPLLGFVAHNWGGFGFHLVVAIIALYLGYGTDVRKTAAA